MELLISSIVAFASTNIDDLFVLMLFFGNPRNQSRHIVAGQYLGIISLIVISFVGSLLGLFLDNAYIGLLGFLPVFLGVKGVVKLFKKNDKKEIDINSIDDKKFNSTWSVASITFANGGDNIGIYIPLFTTLTMPEKAVMICVFLMMTACWCLAGRYLSKHPIVAKSIDQYGHIITPLVLIALGAFILYENGTSRLLSGKP